MNIEDLFVTLLLDLPNLAGLIALSYVLLREQNRESKRVDWLIEKLMEKLNGESEEMNDESDVPY